MLHKLGFRTWDKRNEGISAQGFDTLLKNADKSAEQTYLPLVRHFSSRTSSASATEHGIPTTTSALLVRRLRSGNAPASGPGGKKRGGMIDVRCGERDSPTAVSNGVSTGHRTSPVNLYQLLVDVWGEVTPVIPTCDSYDRQRNTCVQCDDIRMLSSAEAHFKSPCARERFYTSQLRRTPDAVVQCAHLEYYETTPTQCIPHFGRAQAHVPVRPWRSPKVYHLVLRTDGCIPWD